MRKELQDSKKKLRGGFTTGSCAAAAAKAAVWMLMTGCEMKQIGIITPKGSAYEAEIEEICRAEGSVRCAVRKDGGDDPDVTTGALIFAEVSFDGEDLSEGMCCTSDGAKQTTGSSPGTDAPPQGRIRIEGGEGVGVVTRPGLDQPVGNAAINSTPRRMIEQEVREVMEAYDCARDLCVTISVPGGEAIAEKTFNARFGIEGGISIIGTSGVVEPMSEQAILDTIRVELRQRRAEGEQIVSITPGNYGLHFMRDTFDFDLAWSVKCSNFIGLTMDMVAELGFEGVLVTGHAGKLVKVAGGIMNTHSREGDCRMELLAAAAFREGVKGEDLAAILDALTTEEAFLHLEKIGKQKAVAQRLMQSIVFHLRRRIGDALPIECIMYTNETGLLAGTAGAREYIDRIRALHGHDGDADPNVM